MTKRLLISVLGLFFSAMAFCGQPVEPRLTSDLPGITRSTNNIYLIENHSTAFNIWHAGNIKGATLIHLDAHDDCRYIPPERLAILEKLSAKRNFKEIFKQSDIESSFRFQIQPDKFLFDLGNFIYPCIMDGTVARFYWVVPEKTLDEYTKLFLQSHMQAALKLPSLDVSDNTSNSFSFSVSNRIVTITTLDALPKINENALLDIDTDFFVFPNALSESHIDGTMLWDPLEVCSILAKRLPKPQIITISSSISGGYLPVAFRFISDGCFEFFASGTYPEDAKNLLKTVITMIFMPASPVPEVQKPKESVFYPAYEHLEGLSMATRGQDDIAIACVERAASLNPAYAKAMLDLSDAFISMGKIQRAQEMIDRFEKFTACETSQSAAMRVRLYLAEKELGKAGILIQKLIAWDRTPYFLLLSGGILVEEGKLPEATQIYEEIMKLNPNNASAHYNMGVLLSKQNKNDEAVESYKSALKLKPDMAMANENLGYILSNAGKYSEAISYLEKAVRLNPFNVTSLNNLGLAHARRGAFSDAVNYYNMALRLNPERAEIHANLAAALISSGKPGEGIEQCKRALELKPDWPEVINLMNKAERQKSE